MAKRPEQKATGQRDRGTSTHQTGAGGPRPESKARAGSTVRDSQARPGSGAGRSAQPVFPPEDPGPEREDSETGAVRRSAGPRRVLIFAGSLKEAAAIAQRKKYPRELWRFVTGPADTDVDPREWATITVVGFGKDRPLAKDAYDDFQARCRGYGIRVPSYDP